MPSTVADIGGQRFYAWVIAVYLVGSVVAAAAVNPLLVRFGPRASYLLTLAVFGVGTLGCALAPTMELLLVARTVQGAAGGMLAGLGYAVINSALPNWLWTTGVGAGVGDVGRQRHRRPGDGRHVRPIRYLALGLRISGRS